MIVGVLLLQTTGCNDAFTSFQGKEQPVDEHASLTVEVQNATAGEERWEYLIVTFGKTSFSSIEETMKSGDSKLAAFQEFAAELSGHEGIDLQSKLDILGRFGWELIDTIGVISGDQQLLLKRQRIENRFEMEQDALKTLVVILKEESEKKEKRLKEFLDEIERLRSENKSIAQDVLIELDHLEKIEREDKAAIAAEKAITAMFIEAPASYLDKTAIKSIDIYVHTYEGVRKGMHYSGTISLIVDATEALLFDGNKYRVSKAERLLNDFKKEMYKKILIQPRGGGMRLGIEIVVNYKGKYTVVASDSTGVKVPGY